MRGPEPAPSAARLMRSGFPALIKPPSVGLESFRNSVTDHRAEGEGEMSRYVRQKFWEAARALAGDGDIEKRIRFAGDCLIGLQEDQIPVANLEEFLAIRAALFTPSGRTFVPRQVSKEEALAQSRRIVDLFAKILGGL